MTADTIMQFQNLTRNQYSEPFCLDEESLNLLQQLFAFTDTLQDMGMDNYKSFWFTLPSPTYEEFLQREEEYLTEDGYSPDEIRELYEYEYPEPELWYHFASKHFTRNNGAEFMAVFVNQTYLFTVDDDVSSFPVHLPEVVQLLIDKTVEIRKMVKAGTYTEWVEKNLPYKLRKGTISRKAFYDILPEARKNLREAFTEDEIASFEKESLLSLLPENMLDNMTARKFYEACACGYQDLLQRGDIRERNCVFYQADETERAQYPNQKYTPKEYYYMFADGRDNGLRNVPMDSVEDYLEWKEKKGPYFDWNGSHPWEILPSISISNSLHLAPNKDKETGKWYFVLDGDSITRFPDTVHFFLALRKAGIPVQLYCAEKIRKRFTEEDVLKVSSGDDYLFGGGLPDTCGIPMIEYLLEDKMPKEDIRNRVQEFIAAVDWEKQPEVKEKA